MPPIKKVVAGSRNRKREKRMNATTYAKTRNVLVREITMPVVFCKDCKYWEKEYDEYDGEEWWTCGKYEPYNSNDVMHEDDFCSRGERAE